MQKGRAADFLSGLFAKHFTFDVASAGGLGVKENIVPAAKRFASRRGQTHVRVESHDQNGLHTVEEQPLSDRGSRKGAVDVLFKEAFRPESSLWPKTRRELGSPSSGDKCRGFVGLIVMTHPGNGTSPLTCAIDVALDCSKRGGVVRDGPFATGGELVLCINNHQSVSHSCVEGQFTSQLEGFKMAIVPIGNTDKSLRHLEARGKIYESGIHLV